tara:strand:+ start:11985 stop:12485 length:501 start_codon:yes stop_codon:yes gene_type:complete
MRSENLNFKNPLTWFAIGFGAGLFPIAQGTIGSLVACLFFYFFIVPFLKPFAFIFIILIYCLLLISSFFFGLYIYKRTMGEEKDAKTFVWDEFLGIWITCFPLFFFDFTWIWILLSFVLFRVFDVWKPRPIKYFDKMDNSFGVMMDDVVAGFISASIIFIAVEVFY